MTSSTYDAILARTFANQEAAWEDLVALCRVVPPGQRTPLIHVEPELDFSRSSWPEVVKALATPSPGAPLIVIADTHSLSSSPPTVLIYATALNHKAFRCEALHVSRVVAEIAAEPGKYARLARQFDAKGHYTGPPIAPLAPSRDRSKKWRPISSWVSRGSHDKSTRDSWTSWPTGPLVDPVVVAELEAASVQPREEQHVVLHLEPQAWRIAEAIVRREHTVTSTGEALMEVCSSFHNLLVDPRRDSAEGTTAHEFGLTRADLEELEMEVESQALESISQYARLMIANFVARQGRV